MFLESVTPKQAECLVVAALLHDIGHYPYCHPIEDLEISSVQPHEQLAARWIHSEEITDALREDWDLVPNQILGMLHGTPDGPGQSLLQSILSGPIDIDKMDYLYRDSLHAGVPYGMNYDRSRLMGSLCLSESGDRLAITDKGRTAAELMVFARYVMFSEVYWHRSVRSATAMFQRLFFAQHRQFPWQDILEWGDVHMETTLRDRAKGTAESALAEGLFGPRRQLYKNVAQYNFLENPDLFEMLARRPYAELVNIAIELAERLSTTLRIPIASHEVIVDAPPVGLEVQFRVSVFHRDQGVYRSLEDLSPVVQTLARQQFDNYVKKIRIFVHPRIADACQQLASIESLIEDAVRRQ